MISETVTCDECKAVKKETNSWWTICSDQDQSAWLVLESGIHGAGTGLVSRFRRIRRAARIVHLCGAVCVSKYVSRFMGAK